MCVFTKHEGAARWEADSWNWCGMYAGCEWEFTGFKFGKVAREPGFNNRIRKYPSRWRADCQSNRRLCILSFLSLPRMPARSSCPLLLERYFFCERNVKCSSQCISPRSVVWFVSCAFLLISVSLFFFLSLSLPSVLLSTSLFLFSVVSFSLYAIDSCQGEVLTICKQEW